jgi:hypothetical protein
MFTLILANQWRIVHKAGLAQSCAVRLCDKGMRVAERIYRSEKYGATF